MLPHLQHLSSSTCSFAEESENSEEIEAFIDEVKNLHKDIKDDNYEKKGIFTGKYLIHPITNEKFPLYFANFVLADYGTGAVMAVPAHDQRDFDFAKEYDIDIKLVIKPKEEDLPLPLEQAYTEPGILVNSGIFDGFDSNDAKKRMSNYLTESKKGSIGINYRLRDWGISRQRYWGTPIPMVACDNCGVLPVKKESLPVVLPEDIAFSGVTSPIKNMPEFYEVQCPKCGEKAKRETDTMDTFVESSWYYLKYISPKTKDVPFIKDEVNSVMPINQYIGGVEHAVMHLLYTRFFTKALADLGYIDFREPVKNLLTQGMVCMESYKNEDGDYVYPEDVEIKNDKMFDKSSGKSITVGRIEKMSKSKKNVVDPDNMIDKYGADTCRLFTLFAAPPEKDLEWSEDGVEGSYRFLTRVWNIVSANIDIIKNFKEYPKEIAPLKELFIKTHQTIKKVIDDIERFHFNTAISAIMELVNMCYKVKPATEQEKTVFSFALRNVVSLLNPFAPHMTEEIYEQYGTGDLLSKADFPTFDPAALKSDEMLIVVQVNGKVRDKLTVPSDISKREIEDIVTEKTEKYKKFLKSGSIKKIIYIPGKLINVVG